jgi:hypothetical protein
MIAFLFIALLTLIVQYFLPWWTIALVAFGVAAGFSRSARGAFLAGFCAIALVWTGAALFSHIRSGGILTERVAALFSLPFPELLIPVTALIGGLVGGLAALSGFFSRRLFR